MGRVCIALLLAISLFIPRPLGASGSQDRVLVIGDSMLAAHAMSGRSVGHYLEKMLGVQVERRPVIGARMIYKLPITGAMGMSIPQQYRGGDWDWIVMNGGGNDLWLGCGCQKCDHKLDKLIAEDGRRGYIPQLMAKALKQKTRVLYVGYLRSPSIHTPIEDCKVWGDELERRVASLAKRVNGLEYVSLQDLVPPGDLSYFGADRIHPSIKASREIAHRIARRLKPAR